MDKRFGEGRKRPEWSTEEFAAAIELLPDVLEPPPGPDNSGGHKITARGHPEAERGWICGKHRLVPDRGFTER